MRRMKYEKNYTDENLEIAVKTTLENALSGTSIKKEKKAMFVFGQPGSGKHEFAKKLHNENGYAIVSIDKIRYSHPKISEIPNESPWEDVIVQTKEFAINARRYSIERLATEGYNIVIVDTLEDVDDILYMAGILKKFGYQLEIHVMLVKPILSAMHKELEYEIQMNAFLSGKSKFYPHKISNEYHDYCVKKLLENIDILQNATI